MGEIMDIVTESEAEDSIGRISKEAGVVYCKLIVVNM